VAGTRFGMQLAGAVLVEVVYGWPGVGRLIFDAIQKRDYPIIQGAVLFIAFLFVLINLLTDLLYAWWIRGYASSDACSPASHPPAM